MSLTLLPLWNWSRTTCMKIKISAGRTPTCSPSETWCWGKFHNHISHLYFNNFMIVHINFWAASMNGLKTYTTSLDPKQIHKNCNILHILSKSHLINSNFSSVLAMKEFFSPLPHAAHAYGWCISKVKMQLLFFVNMSLKLSIMLFVW